MIFLLYLQQERKLFFVFFSFSLYCKHWIYSGALIPNFVLYFYQLINHHLCNRGKQGNVEILGLIFVLRNPLILWLSFCREVIESMGKVGEANARLKQIEVSLDDSELGKQNADAVAALATENAGALKSEVKRIELMVRITFGACELSYSQ